MWIKKTNMKGGKFYFHIVMYISADLLTVFVDARGEWSDWFGLNDVNLGHDLVIREKFRKS